MEEFTKEELRWIIKQAKQKQKTAVGLPLLTKVFEIERKAVKKLNIDDVSKSFYCETKRGCLEQCDDCALTELAKDMAC